MSATSYTEPPSCYAVADDARDALQALADFESAVHLLRMTARSASVPASIARDLAEMTDTINRMREPLRAALAWADPATT